MSKNNLSTYYKVYKNFLKKIENKNINYKPLVAGLLKKTGGRNNTGKITAYHRGGGVKRLYKKVLYSYFDLLKNNLKKWIVERIEYDSTKSSNIVLLKNIFILKLKKFIKLKKLKFYNYFFNMIYIYRIANENLKKGDIVNFFEKKENIWPFVNQFAKLGSILTGSKIFNIETKPLRGGKLVRAAGSKAKLLRKYEKYGLIELPSKEKKLILLSCYATLGIPSNAWNVFKKYYKAGNSRLRNIRPKVRGVAMNPIDHPHGGGEGKTSGGRHSVSKWGWLTKGYVTKRKKIKKKKKYV